MNFIERLFPEIIVLRQENLFYRTELERLKKERDGLFDRLLILTTGQGLTDNRPAPEPKEKSGNGDAAKGPINPYDILRELEKGSLEKFMEEVEQAAHTAAQKEQVENAN